MDSALAEPPLPLGERIELPGRGTTFVRHVEGPPGAPTVLLLHGWIASGGLNWFNAFGPLSERFSVVAPDLRGHGRGLRTRRRFRLADCADDVAATLERDRHRSGDRRRLLDGRAGGAAPVAPSPRAGERAGPVRHVVPLHQRRARALRLRHR